jgi:hypothetical protein
MGPVLLTALLPLLLAALAFGQTSATLRGVVTDTSKAVIPNATVTAINTETGVETKTTTNNTGIYNFPALQPGTYNISAEAGGFQRAVTTDVRLRVASQISLDFNMAIATTTTEVEVVGTVESMALEAGSSTGVVLQEDLITALPSVTNDVMDMINVMGGVVKAEDPVFSANTQTFAGVAGSNINVVRDGMSVSEVRYSSGVASPNRVNQEMVGEFKMILSPVDAEMGRGAGQVQMTTKSGANAFHGSGVWNIQNSALDASEWENKDQETQYEPNWRNLNDYTLSLSGPIIKNRTFFFATWEQQISRSKESILIPTLTPCARKGIYRYLSGVQLANAGISENIPLDMTSFQTGVTRPNVDLNGKVLENYTWKNTVSDMFGMTTKTAGTVDYNPIQYQSVVGDLTGSARALLSSTVLTDCSSLPADYYAQGMVGSQRWDAYRTAWDASGFVDRFNDLMPWGAGPGWVDYALGDGLNTVGYRWTRTTKGKDTPYGVGMDNNRKSITVKIDHNVNNDHRLSGTYTYESDQGQDNMQTWPDEYGGYGGVVLRKPQMFSVSLTSTLRPTLLNELRVGLSRTKSSTYSPVANPETGGKLKEMLQNLLPTDAAHGYDIGTMAIVPGLGTGTTLFSPEQETWLGGLTGRSQHPYGSMGNIGNTWGGVDPRWTFADTVTWMKGAHSFKGGVELRLQKSWQETDGTTSFAGNFASGITEPTVNGGVLGNYSNWTTYGLSNPAAAPYWTGMTGYDRDRGNGTMTTNYANAYNLLAYVTGSIGSIKQWYYVTDVKNPRWNVSQNGENAYVADLRNRELSFFFKDDWKVTSDLTLNLGVRWEYYGVPWMDSGLAGGVKDGFAGMLGMSNGLGMFPTLAQLQAVTGPAGAGDTGYRTEQIYVGPNSTNENIPVFNKDKNNFAPHVGFSWQLPWLGKGKTTLRGGYSISYTPVSAFDGYGSLATQPGMGYNFSGTLGYKGSAGCTASDPRNTTGDPNWCYIDYSNLNMVLPLVSNSGVLLSDPSIVPMGAAGYTQNYYNRTDSLTVYDPDVRNPYVQSLNLSLTRQIGNAITLDVRYIGTLARKSIGTVNLNTVNFLNSGLFAELEQLRKNGPNVGSYPILNQIKPGALYVQADPFTGAISAADRNLTGAQQVFYQYFSNIASGAFSTIAGSLATANFDSDSTYTGNPEGRAAAGSNIRGQVLREAGLPENLIYANPQYASANLTTNQGHSNYHSMQTQVTMRPTRGLSFQATYTWSRNLATQGIGDYRTWEQQYWLSAQHRSHNLTTYGSYELPFGANGFIFRNAAGAFKKAVEGWQMSWVAQVNSGIPMDVNGTNTLWSWTRLEQVGEFDTKSGKVGQWETSAQGIAANYYYGKDWKRAADPQCASGMVTTATNPYTASIWAPATSLQGQCGSNLQGLYRDVNGNNVAESDEWVFVNSTPGVRGNMSSGNILTGPGRWTLDMALSKSVEFMEGKRIEIRVDAQNIFNHPTPSYSAYKGVFSPNGAAADSGYSPRYAAISNPNVAVNQASYNPEGFGLLNSKAGHRTFQAKIRLSF